MQLFLGASFSKPIEAFHECGAANTVAGFSYVKEIWIPSFCPSSFCLMRRRVKFDNYVEKSSGEPIILFIIDSSASMETPVLKKNSSS
jgi:hypothetical protein